MPLNEFWYGDVRLLEAYKKSYLVNKSFSSWYNGRYVFEAISIAISNALAKKGKMPIPYPSWENPIKNENKKIISQEKYEIVQHKQEMWFLNMLQS